MSKLLVIAVFVAASLFGGIGVAAAADFSVDAAGQGAYVINGQSNPTVTLTRGRTYTFSVVVQGHPFWIKSVQESGASNSYDVGVTNNGTGPSGATPGLLTFAVPASAPAQLFYNCQFHDTMTGVIKIVAAPGPSTPVPATTSVTGVLLGLGLLLLGCCTLKACGGVLTRRKQLQ